MLSVKHKEDRMKCHVFWGKSHRIAVTNKQDGDGLPPEFAPWTYKKSLEIDADDGPRIGADSSEIIEDIERDGFTIWPRK